MIYLIYDIQYLLMAHLELEVLQNLPEQERITSLSSI